MPALYLWLNCASTVSQLRASERLREDTGRTSVTYRSYYTKSCSDKKSSGEGGKRGNDHGYGTHDACRDSASQEAVGHLPDYRN